MRALALALALLVSGSAFAGADGDGFAVIDGDCNDYDPTIYPGATELCDGLDNNCDQGGLLADFLMVLGNGNDGEGLTWASDGLWWHVSGMSNGNEFLESLDITTRTVGANLASGNTYGPDPAGQLIAFGWHEPLGLFLAIDALGHFFHVDTYGNFTDVTPFTTGGSGIWGGGGQRARGLAILGSQVYGVDEGNDQLYELDPATGSVLAATSITIDGAPGIGCSGIAANPTSLQVLALCTDPYWTNGPQLLVDIDPTTGVGLSLGDTGQRLTAIAIDDAGRVLTMSSDINNFGEREAIYELVVLYPGGPEPGELDSDGDGYLECAECNDDMAHIFPGAPEACDGLDSDCDGLVPADEFDGDGDMVSVCDGDCDDTDPFNAPGLPEGCDGLDNNCDGVPGDDEVDLDGDGELACFDCNDNDPAINHSATEICNEIDDDCDGVIPAAELDLDGDGFIGCEECNDNQATVFPGSPEVCDGFDTDCDGYLAPDEEDADGDGVPLCDGDCDDNDALNTPGRPELCDGLDNDCDGAPGADEFDMDGDGELECFDCDDTDASINHQAEEICNGIDDNCDGQLPMAEIDQDGDGAPWCDDCDDNDPQLYPLADEGCDGIDNDCDGLPGPDEADADGDGFMICQGDCDDSDPSAFPGGTEVEDDGIDQDCDGSDLTTGSNNGGRGDKGTGCGCDSASPPFAGWLLIPLLAATRRSA